MPTKRRNRPLAGTVALVTGASRGGGRGIALALGDAGATVYVTGRSRDALSKTARDVTARGGRGIAVRVDHRDAKQIAALFRKIAREQRGLDLLVNNVWGGYEDYDPAKFTAPFWEQPDRWEGMFVSALRAHLLASAHAVPLMRKRPRALLVSTIAWAFDLYLGNLWYDVAKAAIARMGFGMSKELAAHRLKIAALTVAPGFMRTEAVLEAFKTDEAHWRDVPGLKNSESPEYLGRAVAALAADARAAHFTGRILTAGELARVYRLTDVDGRRPKPFRIGKTERWYWKLYGTKPLRPRWR